MYAPTPSDIQIKEFRNQDMRASAARYRLLAEDRQSSERELRPRSRRRVTVTLAYARTLVGLLPAVAVAMTLK